LSVYVDSNNILKKQEMHKRQINAEKIKTKYDDVKKTESK
jgi:hypothetical protein